MTALDRDVVLKLQEIALYFRQHAQDAADKQEEQVVLLMDPTTANVLGMAIGFIPDLLKSVQSNAAVIATLVSRYEGQQAVLQPREAHVTMDFLAGRIRLEQTVDPALGTTTIKVVQA